MSGRYPKSHGLLGLDNDEIAKYACRHPELTLKQVGQEFGCSQQNVNQALTARNLRNKRNKKRSKWLERLEAKRRYQLEREQEHLAKQMLEEPCRVCLGPIFKIRRDGRLTPRTAINCSTQCSELWRSVRGYLDPKEYERHRLAHARSVVGHPDNHPDSARSHSSQILGGKKRIPANRRYIFLDSQKAKDLATVRRLRRANGHDVPNDWIYWLNEQETA